MFLQREAALGCDALLATLDLGVVEFFHAAAIDADQVVVMLAFIELENGFAGFEVVARQQSRLLELGQHAIDGCKADIHLFVEQDAVNIFGAEVALLAGLEDLEDLQTRYGRFETDIFEVRRTRHGRDSLEYNVWIVES